MSRMKEAMMSEWSDADFAKAAEVARLMNQEAERIMRERAESRLLESVERQEKIERMARGFAHVMLATEGQYSVNGRYYASSSDAAQWRWFVSLGKARQTVAREEREQRLRRQA